MDKYRICRCAFVLGLAGVLVFSLPVAADTRRVEEMAHVEDVPGLPRVLIIGDSISIGYTLPVRELLAGVANVHRIPENGGPTAKGIERLDDWLGGEAWDVIHFNWGLHDLKREPAAEPGALRPPAATPDQYRANLERLVVRLEKTGATLVWAATTTVPVGESRRLANDDLAYNAVAAEIMNARGIAINDLNRVARARCAAHHTAPGNVHFTAEGSRVLAEAVAGAVRAALAGRGPARDTAARDWRNIRNGHEIPSLNYADQPYVVARAGGAWVATLTTGTGDEGKPGQHIAATVSTDQGRTWSPLVPIEPPDGPEASWAVPFINPAGRIYVFYSYNGDRLEPRADMLGWYCFKYSGDGGLTWSERHRLPMRVTTADRGNDWQGEHQIFWGICKPIVSGGDVFFSFTKLGRYMLEEGEGWVYRSNNLLTETDPEKLHWELLPEGDHGIRNPAFGSVQEEHNIVALDAGDLYCMYRTTEGYPAHSYSRDRGRTWSEPEFATYAPGGRKMKNPRACPRVWKVRDGHYLFWFHNHSGKDFRDRNPVWVSGGVERDDHIHWSQPEILLYDPEFSTRMSYPDLIVEDGRYFFTETQKTAARVHEADTALVEGLWRQDTIAEVVRDGLVFAGGPEIPGESTAMPAPLHAAAGFTLEIGFSIENWVADTVLFAMGPPEGPGIRLETAPDGAVRLVFGDGTFTAAWESGPASVAPGKRHITAIVDGGPRIIRFVAGGQLEDGGDARQYGWGRYPEALGLIGDFGEDAPLLGPEVRFVRLYNRAITTTGAIGNWRAAAVTK